MLPRFASAYEGARPAERIGGFPTYLAQSNGEERTVGVRVAFLLPGLIDIHVHLCMNVRGRDRRGCRR